MGSTDKQIYFFKKNGIWGGFNRFTLETAYSKDKKAVYNKLFVNKDFILDGETKLNTSIFSPHIFFLIPTYNCNLNCDYCFIKDKLKQNNHKDMSLVVAKKAVNLFINYYAKNTKSDGFILNFYGGEPLLNWKVIKESIELWTKLIKKLGKGSTINLITNGMLIDKNKAQFFKKYKVNISVSLDGSKEITENYRKGLNYDKVLENIALLKKQGVNVNISFTLTDLNCKQLKYEITKLDNSIKPDRILVNMPLPTDGKTFDKRKANKLMDNYFKLFNFMKSKGVSDNIYSILLYRFIEKKIGYHHCSCNKCQVVVDPDGNIGPCHSFLGNKSFYPGNITNNFDLSKIDIFNTWIKTGSYTIKQCKDCIGIGICRGGCRYVSQIINGEADNVDIRFCKNIKKIVEYIVWEPYKYIKK